MNKIKKAIQSLAHWHIGTLAYCLLLLTACQTVEQFSIDYMLPADVSFPATLRRVAVVNNVAAPLNPPKGGNPDTATIYKGIKSSPSGGVEGASSLTAESLAEALAAENYFDEVVICDSALRSLDTVRVERTLSQQEVRSLTESLDVDFLISLEELHINAQRKVGYSPEWGVYLGTTDVKVRPTLRVYLPSRREPMVTVNAGDSIFWEEAGYTEAAVRQRLISDKDVAEQASDFAGTVPIRHLLPSWKTADRYLFGGTSVNMRDAAVLAKEQAWDRAVQLWKQDYDKKKGKQKMYAAYNLALGYEMQDSIPTAFEWAKQALDLSMQLVKDPTAQLFFAQYVNELQKRADGLPRLGMQMSRFDDED